ncbi:hypothetical protein GIB67_002115 [Kingdonia uniflora]|uniref:Uncharacterized protein n=1 Tax=Kingdonia uniflora TaxID=39325 RepID=A0A7J7KWT5_9MAGN|nr:hypothetical protein GIB67_002115 [Kingdonia uniflora]
MTFNALQHRIPTMMKLSGKPEVSEGDSLFCYNCFLYLDSGDIFCIIDRVVISALQKMTRGVAWENLDILVVDMPPGPGDGQLTISQRLQLSASLIDFSDLLTCTLIVSTPHGIALIDARRGANIFYKVEVLILGVIENMSCFKCSHCGEPSYIFGSEGACRTADDMDMEFLGEIY